MVNSLLDMRLLRSRGTSRYLSNDKATELSPGLTSIVMDFIDMFKVYTVVIPPILSSIIAKVRLKTIGGSYLTHIRMGYANMAISRIGKRVTQLEMTNNSLYTINSRTYRENMRSLKSLIMPSGIIRLCVSYNELYRLPTNKRCIVLDASNNKSLPIPKLNEGIVELDIRQTNWTKFSRTILWRCSTPFGLDLTRSHCVLTKTPMISKSVVGMYPIGNYRYVEVE